MTLDSDRIHWHGGGGREDSVLGTWIDSLCIDISKLSLSSRGITASRMAISKGWYVVAVGHTIQCDSVTVIHKYKFQCFGAAEGPGQTSRTRRPFLLSDSMSVRMDTEEVWVLVFGINLPLQQVLILEPGVQFPEQLELMGIIAETVPARKMNIARKIIL